MAILEEVKPHYGRLGFYINGKWFSNPSNEIFVDKNPAKDEEIAQVEIAGEREVELAISSAYEAFLKWREVPFRDRADYLSRLRTVFQKRHEELSRVLVQDHGRTISEARGTIQRCIENIESALSALYSLYKGEHVMQLARDIDCYMLWEPVGVFLILTPNNIPMHAWSSFVPYALACGCTVIVSPSYQNPVAADMVFRVCEEVGLPPGVMNLIHVGEKYFLNRTILEDKRVMGVGFIGSSKVGKGLFELCGSLGKRSSINGNGKNHIVILEDADLNKAVEYVLRGCFGMTGQRCLGSDNVLVQKEVYGQFKELLIERSKSMKLGYGLDESTEMGPLTSKQGMERVLAFLDKGLSEGARLILDGRNPKVEGYERGYFVGPCVLEDVTTDMWIAKEESFGPICNLIPIDNLDQAIEIINKNTEYGHSACLVTNSGKNARKFIYQCNVGNVGINAGIPQPYAFYPLGSRKESFFGMAKSRIDSVRLFLDQKTVTERWV